MMLNKRLINIAGDSRKYIFGNVLAQWISLISNIAIIYIICNALQMVYQKNLSNSYAPFMLILAVLAVIIRFVCSIIASKMSYFSSKSAKSTLRTLIYQKLLKLGASYNQKISTSEVVQMSVEGVDKLETYFGAYLPQFFYSILSPVTLFIVLSFIHFPAAIILFICVPLIPISIAAVQTFAQKLLSGYWKNYVSLGDAFLENLQGLTTLKIYNADKFKNDSMNAHAENFRKITMRVLTMQLNSITIMDLIAFGGSAAGVILSVNAYLNSQIQLSHALFIILISAEFFIPLRLLGSFFHVAMNGMTASEKIFALLDMDEPLYGKSRINACRHDIVSKNVNFSYNSNRLVVNDFSAVFPMGSFTSIVGESGSGKSTFASILTGQCRNYQGSILISGTELSDISEDNLMQNITYIGHNSFLFKGTIRDNLLMANESASDSQLLEVISAVNLMSFLESNCGLDTLINENASNLSGGQRQKIAFARALLHDSSIYIFDEASSNIDVESENDIMSQIIKMRGNKTVILITHRLANAIESDNIIVMESGKIREQGKHIGLISQNGLYAKLWDSQQALENFDSKRGVAE